MMKFHNNERTPCYTLYSIHILHTLYAPCYTYCTNTMHNVHCAMYNIQCTCIISSNLCKYQAILLRKITAAKNEFTLSYHIVRDLYLLADIFAG